MRFFSLKNTPLWLGRAEQLGFDVEGFSGYGDGGAGCDHWEVESDADYVKFLFPGGRPNRSKRTDAVPAGALEKKVGGSFTRLEVMERNRMASFTCDDDAFLERDKEADKRYDHKGITEVRSWLLDIDYCRPMFMDESGWTKLWLLFTEMTRIILAQLPRRTTELGQIFGSDVST